MSLDFPLSDTLAYENKHSSMGYFTVTNKFLYVQGKLLAWVKPAEWFLKCAKFYKIHNYYCLVLVWLLE